MARPSDDRGTSAVEFALVLPILLILVMGIIEFGRAYNMETTVSGAAREAARVMAVQNDPAAARAAAKSAAANLQLIDTQIVITPVTCTTNATTTVTISYPMTFVTKFFGTSITLKGTGVMRCNG